MGSEPSIDRPGGFTLTDRALKLCSFRPGDLVLDVGCGKGATVDYLRDELGLEATGFDIDAEEGNPRVVPAKAESLPLPDGVACGVLMECSLSVFEHPLAALGEAARVIREGGALAISTIYARRRSAYLGPRLGRAYTAGSLIDMVAQAGFEVRVLEDHSRALREFWGQAILDRGAEAACSSLGVDPAAIRSSGCGYCLLVAARGRFS